MLETERLILRRWEESDAENLYQYAKDPDVGPIAGWPPHQSVKESLDVIRNVFNGPEAYAICLKKDNKAIGAIELKLNGHTDMTERDDECELGYWLGKPFWGQGIVPEAAREMLRHAFEDIGMQKVWCGYYDGNLKSKRVQEKCGFRYQWTTEGVDVPLMHEERTGHVNLMTKDDWLWRKLYEAARSVHMLFGYLFLPAGERTLRLVALVGVSMGNGTRCVAVEDGLLMRGSHSALLDDGGYAEGDHQRDTGQNCDGPAPIL